MKQLKIIQNKDKIRAGFSLVEIAIVILVLGMLLVVVFSVVNGIIQISISSSPSREAKRQALFAMQTLTSSIEQTYFRSNDKRIWFVGKKDGVGEYRKDRLTFAAVHSGAQDIGAPAIREVSYYIKEQEDDGYVLMRREDEMVDDEPGKGGAHYEILPNVQSLEFSYSSRPNDWLESWDSRNKKRLPKLVKITLQITINKREYIFKRIVSLGLTLK